MSDKTYESEVFESELEALKKYQEFGVFRNRSQIEGVIFEINKTKLISNLEKIGAERVLNGIQEILTYDFPNNSLRDNFIVLRTKEIGGITELQYKKLIFENGRKARKEKEMYFVLHEPEKVKSDLKDIGLVNTGLQERELISYLKDGIRYNIETWPNTPTYVGIEVKDYDDLSVAAQQAELNPDELTQIGGVDIFKRYNLTLTNAVFKK